MCLISIITITYNAEKELPSTMKSIAEQTFGDYEHLIIDGASKDGTVNVAAKMRTERTRIISEPDKGLYDAMNKGLRQARGEYVLFLNAGDCFAAPDVLASFADGAATGADIIYGDTDIVDCEGTVIGHRHHSAPDVLTFESFSRGMLICHQAFMVKRSLSPEYDLSYRFSADYDWTVKCIKRTSPERCHNLRRVAIHYLSDGLTDRNKVASLKERFRIMRGHYGLPKTLARHFGMVLNAVVKRSK
ncbi:MAG: glycosyltransferase [Muribaculaceae bacterium]|nr:glycosyltransferase [Muribaculaceae bacterium]